MKKQNHTQILFVCTANKDRSKTAEILFDFAYPKYQFKSAGTSNYYCQKHQSQLLNQQLLNWASKIVVMEQAHAKHITTVFGTTHQHKIQVLNLPDDYHFMSTSLIDFFKAHQQQILA